MIFQLFEQVEEQHREQDDGEDGRVHAGIVGDGAAVADDVADAGRGDLQLGEDRADEAGRDAEAEAREDHRRGGGNDDLEQNLAVVRRGRTVPISFSDGGVLRTAPAVFSTMTGIAMMQTTKTLEVSPIP